MPREKKSAGKFREAGVGDGTGPGVPVEGATNRQTETSPARKKRKGSTSNKLQASPSLPELVPPHTIIAGNPFDDQPAPITPTSTSAGSMQQTMGSNKPHPSPTNHPNTGKVYPPNQPMVFNASNPNAPPIYPCGTCHKEVHENDQAILCESGCNFWFHRMCTGLTEIAYTMLTAEVYAEWVCDKCLASKNIPLVKMKS